MAQQEEIVLWIDRRWKNAIEKHLKDETLQEHLENVLDELCNQLPEREYERISRAIQSEAAVQRAEEEAARTYAAYHVTERGQEWYFKTSPGEELLTVGKKLRSYITSEKAAVPDLFIKMFAGGCPITAEEYNALTAVRMENTGKVRGVFDVNFDKREFSAVHIMDGWQTWAMRDVSVASYHATRSYFASADEQWRKLLNHLNGKEITSAGHLSARNFTFGEEIIESDGKLSLYEYLLSMKASRITVEAKIYEIISYLASYLKENRLNEENGQPINKTDLQALAELTHYMDEHYSFNITLQTLSTIACMSESKMKKLFKSVYNMSITEYIQRKRISVAEHMLIQTDLTIAEISRIVGYSNPSRLIEIFKRYYGFTPSKYRK